MNKVILMGRLTRDPDIRYSQGENAMAIARYTLAVDRRGRKDGSSEQTADFISCVSFGKYKSAHSSLVVPIHLPTVSSVTSGIPYFSVISFVAK